MPSNHSRSGPWLVVAALAVLAACGDDATESDAAAGTPAESNTVPAPSASIAVSDTTDGTPAEPEPANTPTQSASDVATLRTLIDAAPLGSPTLTVLDEFPDVASGAATLVSYESDGFVVTGVLHAPDGDGPFPGAVLIHGFVDDLSFTTGSELARERERLVELGFLVLVPDLRSAGGSDQDRATGTDLEIGWTIDTIEALRALAAEPNVDPARLALIGQSLGGLVVLNAAVVAPDTASAVVALAPSSTDLWDNITRFLEPGHPVRDILVTSHGTPDDNPEFWTDMSPRTFVDRAGAPLLIVHGSADDIADPAWSSATADVWEAAGKPVDFVLIEGADHALNPDWAAAMAEVENFLAANL